MSLGATEFENQRNLYRQQVEKAKETYDPTDMAIRQLTESFAPLIGTESTLTGVKQLISRGREARALANRVRNLKPDLNGRFSQAVQNLRTRVGLNPELPADAEDPIQMEDPNLDTELPPGINTPYPSRPEVDDPLDQDEHDEGFDRGVDSVDQTARETGQVPEADALGDIQGSDSFRIGARAGQLARISQYAEGGTLPDAIGLEAPVASTVSSRSAALADTNTILNNLQSRNWNPETAVPAKLRGQTAIRAMANNNLKLASGAELNDGDLASEALPERPPIEYNPETLIQPPTQSNESLGIELGRHQQRLAQANKTLSDLDDVESKLQTIKDAGGDVNDTLQRLQNNRAAVQATQNQALDDIEQTKAAMRSGAPEEDLAPRTPTTSSLQEQAYHDGLEGAEAPEDDGLLSSYAAGRSDSASMDALKAARPALTGDTGAGAGAGAEAGTTAATTATEAGTEATVDTLSAGLDALGPETGGIGFVLGGLAAAGGAIAAAVAKKKSAAPPSMPNVTVPSFGQGLI